MITLDKDEPEFHYVSPVWFKVARLAFGMVCVSPLALLVIGLCFPVRTYNNWHATPPAFARVLWWALCLFAPAGTVFGAVALRQIGKSVPLRAGSNYAAAAIVVGALASLGLYIGSGELNDMRLNEHTGWSMSCLSNEKEIGLAFLMYLQDYDETFPIGRTWNDGTYPYIKSAEVYKCPREEEHEVPSYAFNGSLGGRESVAIKDKEKTVLIFDSIPGKNRTGWTELLPSPPRHNGGFIAAFVDGHVHYWHDSDAQNLIWHLPLEPKRSKTKHSTKR